MKKAIVGLTIVTLLLGVSFTVYSQNNEQTAPRTVTAQFIPINPDPVKTVPADADTIFILVNNERMKAGVKPLVRDARLDQSAQIKADDMVNDGYYNHIDPVTGVSGYKLIPGNLCYYGSENLNNGQTHYSSLSTVQSWMHSESHKKAILDESYDLSGIAISGDYVVQHFCDLL